MKSKILIDHERDEVYNPNEHRYKIYINRVITIPYALSEDDAIEQAKDLFYKYHFEDLIDCVEVE